MTRVSENSNRGLKGLRLIVAAVGFVFLISSMGIVGCSVEDREEGGNGKNPQVQIDGSSTVFPISQAVAEEFQKLDDQEGVKVVVGTSGTGGGFKKFYAGEIDISDASRPIKDGEKAKCKDAGIDYLELRVAIDGLSVVVNPENDWCSAMTAAQLKKLWEPGSTVTKWNELDPSWPDEEIKLYGPDTDSGTFDYFTEAICGEGGESRTEYTPSADDNVLVKGVSGDKYALGYFGYAYYKENSEALKALAIAASDDISTAVAPTGETIEGGKYTPLSRPLFLYVSTASLKRKEVADFLTYYLSDEGQDLVDSVGYVRVSGPAMEEARKTLADAIAEAQK